MTLIETDRLPSLLRAQTVLYELTAQKLYTCYKADITAYVIVIQNIKPRVLPAASAAPTIALPSC